MNRVIKNIKQAVRLPVIRLIKGDFPGSGIFITPTLEEVKSIIEVGADIVTLDLTDREGRLEQVGELFDFVHKAGAAVMGRNLNL